MRRRKRDLVARVNGNLTIAFGNDRLTSYAGLELLGRYLRVSDFNRRVRRAFQGISLRGAYPWISMIRLLLVMIWVGARRLRHVRYLSRDPLVRRMAGLRVVPDERTLSRWLKQFSRRRLEGLARLNRDLVFSGIRRLRLRRLTIDVDGTVVSTGLKVSGAARGFNPHHRKVPSYYPLTAHVAQTGQVLALRNRPGNVHDGKRAVGFLRDLIRELRGELGRRVRLEFRLDGAFFLPEILGLLEGQGCFFAVKVPMWRWLGLKERIQMRVRWQEVWPGISAFETRLAVPVWGLRLRVVCYRKKGFHPTAKNYQLDLFSPDDGTYEYSAVATNLGLDPGGLWHFMAGRGAQEKTLAELKDGLAFGSVPTNSYGANSAWQWLSVLAHNLFRDFQLLRPLGGRRRSRKRTYLFAFESIKTARFEWLSVAGRLVTLAQGLTLRLPSSPGVEARYHRWLQMLPKAA
jgi:hypothetical protein